MEVIGISKKFKISIILISSILVFTLTLFFIAPFIRSIAFKNKTGGFNDWNEHINYNGFNYCSNENVPSIKYVPNPKEDDKSFMSNTVIKVDDGLYIVGCYGATNWATYITVFQRKNPQTSTEKLNDIALENKNLSNEEKSEILADNLFNYKIEFLNSNNSLYSEKPVTIFPSRVLFGYETTSIIASPTTIENNNVTLKISYGDNFSKVKYVDIKVKNETIDYKKT